MRRGLVLLSLMVAAVVLCNHGSATAEEQQVKLADASNSSTSPWTLSVPSENYDGCYEIFKCVLYPNRSCITECCKSYPFSLYPTKNCVCWYRAEHVNKQVFTAIQQYCGFKQYTVCPHMQVSFLPSLHNTKREQYFCLFEHYCTKPNAKI
uniref:Uncharacterized protein isoform X2 n=1 Tax=Nicotiana tabacum TaxID=4097 RepID=A0A1S3ZRC6_TOBAC|nr:PREDICTED: uncharacterized protein LOC107789727 isoform X2 [Nicotiana tabacum]